MPDSFTFQARGVEIRTQSKETIYQLINRRGTMKKILTLIFLLSGILISLPAISHATTLYVDDDVLCEGNIPCYGDIQSAISAAMTGDTVYVFDGTYNEDITLKSGVVVQGAGADVTTIQGTGSMWVVTASGVDSSAKIDGFTITGGNSYWAGGICCYNNSSPTISNNIISNNYSYYYGAGVSCNNSSPIISNNIISNNYSYYYGGGIACITFSSPTISNNIISNNNASNGWGGGIYCINYSSPTISNNTISDNYAINGFGGGISSYFYSSPTILNNIISDNQSSAGWGGGIASSYFSSPTIDYNDVWNNSAPQYYGCSAGADDISDDPMFVNALTGDFHLLDGSPCIDVGSNADAAWPTDLDGNIRVVDGDGDGWATVDIGALENTSLVEQFAIDIKPGTDMNCINPAKKGNTPVAIFGSASLAVSSINTATIEIDDDGNAATPGVLLDKSSIKDVNGDGVSDLIVHFDTPTMKDEGLLDTDGAMLFITGDLVSGKAILGFDVIHLTTAGSCSK